MAVFQKYLFLREEQGGTGGHIKLLYGAQTRAEVRITAPIEEPELLLLGEKTLCIPLERTREGCVFCGETDLEKGRLIAAVHMHGQLLLAGESELPRADWQGIQRRIRDKLRRERTRETLPPPRLTPYPVQTRPKAAEGPAIKAHAGQWSWREVRYRDGKGFRYLAGTVEKENKVLAVAVAVPGAFAQTPPRNLRGFCGYLDGYWVLAQDARTGRRLEI